jgi:hypothetical protein
MRWQASLDLLEFNNENLFSSLGNDHSQARIGTLISRMRHSHSRAPSFLICDLRLARDVSIAPRKWQSHVALGDVLPDYTNALPEQHALLRMH